MREKFKEISGVCWAMAIIVAIVWGVFSTCNWLSKTQFEASCWRGYQEEKAHQEQVAKTLEQEKIVSDLTNERDRYKKRYDEIESEYRTLKSERNMWFEYWRAQELEQK